MLENGCSYSVDWKVYRTSDDADMVITLPSNFEIDTNNDRLSVSHTLGDFTERLSLYTGGIEGYYFEGTFDDDAATLTPKYSFTIDFQDDCQTATI